MPIHQKSHQFPAIGLEAQLSGFVGRLDARAQFFRHLNAVETPNRVLFVHGDSGNGKSLLLRKLRTEDCVLIPDADRWPEIMSRRAWDGASAAEQAQTIQRITAERKRDSCPTVPTVLVDFAGASQWLQDLRDPLTALTEVRRQLLDQGFRTPLFDFGIVLWLQKTGQFDRRSIQLFLGSAGIDVLATAIEEFSDTLLLSAVPKVVKIVFSSAFGKAIDERFSVWLTKRHLNDEAEAIALSRLDARSELPLKLPELLARDINANLAEQWVKTARLAFFFDTHEAFWSEQTRYDGTSSYHSRDEWLRRFIGALDYPAGVVVVLAGREPPCWADSPPPTRIPDEYVERLHLEGLSEPEATTFLAGVGVSDEDQRRQLIDECSAGTKHCHPLYLALAAETVCMRAAAANAGDTRQPLERLKLDGDLGRALLDRFLRYCDTGMEDAVRLLSAPRAFNREMYLALATRLNAEASVAAFNRICRFSFVYRITQSPAQSGPAPTYRIHELIRRSFRDRGDPRVAEADRALHLWFEVRAADRVAGSRVEALYHLSKANAKAARESWLNQFAAAHEAGNFELGAQLIGVFDELAYEDIGRVSALSRIATFWLDSHGWTQAGSAVAEALSLARSPEFMARWGSDSLLLSGNAEIIRARLLATGGDYQAARESFERAIADFDGCALNPSNRSAALNNAGLGWLEIAEVISGSSKPEAIEACTRASQRFVEASKDTTSMWMVVSNLAAAQTKLATLVAADNFAEARRQLDAALTNAGNAVRLAPDQLWLHELNAYVHWTYAQAHSNAGDQEAAGTQFDAAFACLQRSGSMSPSAKAPPIVAAAICIAAVQLMWADGEEEAAYRLIKASGQLLRRASDVGSIDLHVYVNRSATQMMLAQCHRYAGRPKMAVARSEQALRNVQKAAEAGLTTEDVKMRKLAIEMYVRDRRVEAGKQEDVSAGLHVLHELGDENPGRLREAPDALLSYALAPLFPKWLQMDRHSKSFIDKYAIALDVFFDHRGSSVDDEDRAHLAALTSRVENTNFEVIIVVGLAERGEVATEDDGNSLSLARAEAVKRVLVQLGIKPNRIYCEGQGCSGAAWAVPTVNGVESRRVAAIEAIGTRFIA